MPLEGTRQTEWPTVGVIAAVYAGMMLIIWFHESLPWWLILPFGAYLAALHTSLQHEVLHGHPTANRLVNEAMVFPTLTLWLPYHRYRQLHLTHHNDANLTDPRLDPESYYMLPEHWAAVSGIRRVIYEVNQTLAGRMLIGPAVSIIRFWSSEYHDFGKNQHDMSKSLICFIVSASITMCYVAFAAGMPLWQYLVLIAYPGISLALVRSYCEHRAAEKPGYRTIVVEASPFWSLLFLNNNLHVAHHDRPALAWYKLPAYYRAERERLIAQNNGYMMKGYGEIFRRYFLKAKEPVAYPNMDWLKKL